MKNDQWRASPILGVRNVRRAAEYYRDVLGFSLDPVDGVFQPAADEPAGVYAIVKRAGAWIHLQIRRGDLPPRARDHSSGTSIYTWAISTVVTPTSSSDRPRSYTRRERLLTASARWSWKT